MKGEPAVRLLCARLAVAPSGYCRWQKGGTGRPRRPRNPLTHLWGMPRQPAYTAEELAAIERVWGKFPRRDFVLFYLIQNTGLRISEALRITMGDIWNGTAVRPVLVVARRNLKNGQSPTRKKRIRSREIPLNAAILPVLQEYLLAEGFGRGDLRRPLFMSRKGQALSRRQATWRLRQVLLAAGLNQRVGFGWHGGRRSFAQEIYLRTSRDIVVTSKCLGHQSLQVTSEYLSCTDEACAAAIMSLATPAASSPVHPSVQAERPVPCHLSPS
jgi:integrase